MANFSPSRGRCNSSGSATNIEPSPGESAKSLTLVLARRSARLERCTFDRLLKRAPFDNDTISVPVGPSGFAPSGPCQRGIQGLRESLGAERGVARLGINALRRLVVGATTRIARSSAPAAPATPPAPILPSKVPRAPTTGIRRIFAASLDTFVRAGLEIISLVAEPGLVIAKHLDHFVMRVGTSAAPAATDALRVSGGKSRRFSDHLDRVGLERRNGFKL